MILQTDLQSRVFMPTSQLGKRLLVTRLSDTAWKEQHWDSHPDASLLHSTIAPEMLGYQPGVCS